MKKPTVKKPKVETPGNDMVEAGRRGGEKTKSRFRSKKAQKAYYASISALRKNKRGRFSKIDKD